MMKINSKTTITTIVIAIFLISAMMMMMLGTGSIASAKQKIYIWMQQ